MVRRSFCLASRIVLWLNIVVCTLFGLAGMVIVPKFREVFDELNVELPWVTQTFLSLPIWVYGLTGVACVLVLFIKEVVVKNSARTLKHNLVALVILAVLIPAWGSVVCPPVLKMREMIEAMTR